MDILVGTSGYSYKEWKGDFYPEDLPSSRMLRYYGDHFQTVEINNTFYRMPSKRVLAGWAEEVPDGFRFALKASRAITHQRRLKGADDAVAYLWRNAATLGDKLGPLLFQLPPFLGKDIDRLGAFLGLLPKGCRAALEFRHATWFDDETFATLREHNAALCITDAGDPDESAIVPTADFGYIRFRQKAYSKPTLAAWAKRIREQSWERAFVFFKHEDEAAGPKLAIRFDEMLKS
jgi:uncharacterized protein YecE (DUF72 family)